jgi:hypothetical protein
MARLSIEELISKREACEKRKETKYIDVHSEFLGGEIRFHSVDKLEIADFRDRLKSDSEKALLYFAYRSSKDLQDKKLLKAFGRDKTEEYKIVEDLFGTESERQRLLEILLKINGLGEVNPEEFYEKEVTDLKNELRVTLICIHMHIIYTSVDYLWKN